MANLGSVELLGVVASLILVAVGLGGESRGLLLFPLISSQKQGWGFLDCVMCPGDFCRCSGCIWEFALQR
ncbi:hypothetical protein AVEN_128396-1, partial [Araneus ventricosus]